MIFASKEKINELYVLENEYFDLKETNVTESARCILRGELVKGFVKSAEMVDEAIEKLSKIIKELKIEKEKEEELKKKLPSGAIRARYEGYDKVTGEKIHVGDWIVKTDDGWAKIEIAS